MLGRGSELRSDFDFVSSSSPWFSLVVSYSHFYISREGRLSFFFLLLQRRCFAEYRN